ncbi:MAG: sigma-70 family RNA polymerase sigma factor [Pseudomonadota bacterium]|nr:sigma-70 family RNA polymerase sigma factor [Pseudomonadota bacterium]MEC8146486.1 sigma-70 family RNA polymerase sigma factor [Pseudomonadota bacterium]MEC8378031.1 sigma-70 family RNA polymerase sigma factor [Pseudomonadota bacterium]
MNSEKSLINLVKKGDKKAYEVLVLQYQDRLVFSVYKFLKDYELAQDIAQEAFVKAFKNIEKFRGDSSFYTWIYRIAINTAKNFLSSKSRKSEIYDDEIMELKLSESAVTSENPENILEAEELRSMMMDAIQSLPDDIRTTLSLREFDGLSYEEIAEVQNCPIGTVRSRIHKGREILDKTFSKYNMSNLETNLI